MNIKHYKSITFEAEIFIGLRRGYGDNKLNRKSDIERLCMDFTDKYNSFVSISEKTFIYNGQIEPALGIKVILYPKFQKEIAEIKKQCLGFARNLLEKTAQHEIGVIFTDETIVLENLDFSQ
jgi:hypothetical protein